MTSLISIYIIIILKETVMTQSEFITRNEMFFLRIEPIFNRILKKYNSSLMSESKNKLITYIIAKLDHDKLMSQSDMNLYWQIQNILETNEAEDVLKKYMPIPIKRRSNYDVRHKETLRIFLREYFELFFPDLEKRMLFDTAEFKDKELIALFGDRDDPVQLKIVDALILIQIVIDQTPEWIVIHWENQGEKQTYYPERMFHLFCGIYYQFRKLVFSIAMFTDSNKWQKPISNTYKLSLLNYPINDFSYRLLKLKHINASEFEKQKPDNPLTWAYLPLTDYPKEMRPSIKAKSVEGIFKTASNEKQKATLLSLIDHTLTLTDKEEKQYRELIKTNLKQKEDNMLETMEDYYQEKIDLALEKKEIEIKKQIKEQALDEARNEIISNLLLSGMLNIEQIAKATCVDNYIIQTIAERTLAK